MGKISTPKDQIKLNDELVAELTRALNEIGAWGSVEIYVQNGNVTQITKRAIKKTAHKIAVTP